MTFKALVNDSVTSSSHDKFTITCQVCQASVPRQTNAGQFESEIYTHLRETHFGGVNAPYECMRCEYVDPHGDLPAITAHSRVAHGGIFMFYRPPSSEEIVACAFPRILPKALAQPPKLVKKTARVKPLAETAVNTLVNAPLPPMDKIKLTGKLHYPNVTRKPRGRALETIDGEVLASEPDENGERWLSLYDLICMYTGKRRNTVEVAYSRKGADLTKCNVGIERTNVLTLTGSNVWKPTPAIKSSDMLRIGVALNANVASMAACTFTRLIGGDVTMVRELEENREIQEELAVSDPTNVMRIAGEVVEALENPAIAEGKQQTEALIQNLIADPPPPTIEPEPPRVFNLDKVVRRFNLSHALNRQMAKDDLQSKNRFYVISGQIRPDIEASTLHDVIQAHLQSPHEGVLLASPLDAPQGFCKVGYSANMMQRLDDFHRDFKKEVYSLELKLVERQNQAKKLETEVKKYLRNQKVLTSQNQAPFIIQSGKNNKIAKKMTELIILSEEFDEDDLLESIGEVKVQVGIALGRESPATPNPYILTGEQRIKLAELKMEGRREAIKIANSLGDQDLLREIARAML
jgi:hypothetical protein